jgi:hypothetical protein
MTDKEEIERLRELLSKALEALEETGIRWPFINNTIQEIKKELRKVDREITYD